MIKQQGNDGSTIYVPVDTKDAKLRSILTKDMAEELLRQIPNIEPIVVGNEKLIEEVYKKL